MKRYIALLKGINISGKNKIAMAELKEGIVDLGFDDVVTYLNSGNVIFCSDIDDKGVLSDKINGMMIRRYTTTLYLSCRLCLVKRFVMKLEILKMSMRKYIVITWRFFGHLFARIIKRLIGGQELLVVM